VSSWPTCKRCSTEGRDRGSPAWIETEAGESISASVVLLATGFARRAPGGGLLARAVAELGLPLAPCGRPVISPSLEWAPGLHVTGGLAELEIGASAPNIAGAMRCAWAIVGRDRGDSERSAGRETRDAGPAAPRRIATV